jgi:hypothetical protein
MTTTTPSQSRRGMVWYGMVPLLPPVSVFCLSLKLVASCSVHPVSERHRQAVQPALVRIWVRPCDAGIGKEWNRGRLPASDEVIGHIYFYDAPASRCQQRGGWTTRVSAPYIDSSVVRQVHCPPSSAPPGTLALGIALGFGHRRVAGRSRALHFMRLRVVVLLAELLLPPLQLPGSARLGGTTHSSSTAGTAGLCCALPCLALLVWYGVVWYGAPPTPSVCSVTEGGGVMQRPSGHSVQALPSCTATNLGRTRPPAF